MNKTKLVLIPALILLAAIPAPARGGGESSRAAGAWTWDETATLRPDDAAREFAFGRTIVIDGDTALVGAPTCSGGPYCIRGVVYVFVRTGAGWTRQATLMASDTPTGLFGISLAVNGDTALIGSEEASGLGAAYVFERSGSTWTEQAKLTASSPLAYGFGRSVAIEGDTALVGAPLDGTFAYQQGAAYVFVRSGSTWTETAQFLANDPPDAGQNVGHSVALCNGTALVGAMRADGAYDRAGAVHVYVGAGSTWTHQAKLIASDGWTQDNFGGAVALDGDVALIGAPGADGPSYASGAAYVFTRTGSSWNQDAKLKSGYSSGWQEFAWTVSLSDGLAALTGLIRDTSGNRIRKAYVFARSGSSWTKRSELAVDPWWISDIDGVAIDGDTVMVKNTPIGSGGQEQFQVLVFRPGDPGTGYCFGDPGSGTPCPCGNDNDGSVPGSGCSNGVFPSGAQLTASGIASVSLDSLVLQATGLEPNNTGLYFQADDAVGSGNGVVFGDGLRCAGGNLVRLEIAVSDGAGNSSTTVPLAAIGGASAGDTMRYQCWYRTTTNPPCGLGVNDFNLSNGYELAWGL